MKPENKRWVMIFSLALNIGFVIMAAYGLYAHYLAGPSHIRHIQAIEQSLQELDLPPQIKQQAKAEYSRFLNQMGLIRSEIRATGHNNFELLSREGTFDQQAFDQNWAKIFELGSRKYALVKEHLMNMHQILGPEYSAAFFNDVKLKTQGGEKQK